VGIFVVQAGMLGFALWRCAEIRPEDQHHALVERCPTLGDRFEATGNVAIATVLSLLTGKFMDDPTQ
jgi:hypothetical protein